MFVKQRFIYNKDEQLLYNKSELKMDKNKAAILSRSYYKQNP